MANILDRLRVPKGLVDLMELQTDELRDHSDLIGRTQAQLQIMISRGDFSPEQQQRLSLTISQLKEGRGKILDVVHSKNLSSIGG